MARRAEISPLRRLRLLRRMRLHTTARALGVTPATLREWEMGRRRPLALKLSDLADVLGVPLDRVVRAVERTLRHPIRTLERRQPAGRGARSDQDQGGEQTCEP